METKPQEISLKQLFWKIMFGWRLLLIFAVGGAVLLTAGVYVKDMSAYRAALQTQTGQTETEYVFTEEEQEQIDAALELQQQIADAETYMQESILMNIDPYEENVLRITFYVKSDYSFNYTEENQPDYTSAVVSAYMEYAQNGSLASQLAASGLDCSEKYIQELIRVSASDYSTRIFCIELVYSDEDTLPELADTVTTALQEQTAELSEQIGTHTLTVLEENTTVELDTALITQKKTYQDTTDAYQTKLDEKKAAMTEQQLAQLEISETEEEQTSSAAETVAAKPGISVKYMVLGFLLGLFLAAAWVTFQMLYMTCVQDSEELNELFQMRLFGTYHEKEKLSALDRLLVRLKNRHKKQLTQEQEMDVIVSNLELACENDQVKSMYLTGSEIEKADPEVIRQMTERLEKAGIEVVYGENICYHAASMRKLAEVGAAVLVEQVELSKYQEIAKEIRAIGEQKVTLLGCVAIANERS